LYDCGAEYIAIQTELSHLKNYIDIESVRKGDNVTVTFINELEQVHFSIAPMLLMPFVENAFKYVPVSPGSKNIININTRKQEGEFVFVVENNIGAPAMVITKSGGIGIENVKRRLELLYPGCYTLNIEKNTSIFKVTMKIKIA
jgi:LytS/YehU family sensor histidine kinase